jgi:Uma2 family endonuclease
MTNPPPRLADATITLEEFQRMPEENEHRVELANRAAEIREKVLEYLAAGTRLVWVVDPATRSVATYRSFEDIRLLTEEDTLEGGDVLPGFTLPLSELFPLHSGRPG